jgi:hypothetical protein
MFQSRIEVIDDAPESNEGARMPDPPCIGGDNISDFRLWKKS